MVKIAVMLAKSYRARSPSATQELGMILARNCRGGEVFLLSGELGAGKTCLAQGIARGLNITQNITSPTFVIHTQYSARDHLTLNHFDFYRLENCVGDDFAEWFNQPQHICVLEWAEKIAPSLPRESIKVQIDRVSKNRRNISITATAPNSMQFIERL